MVERLSPPLKAVVAIILAGMLMIILIPLTCFVTVSFSNATEMAQFPKRLLPTSAVTVFVAPEDDGKYTIFYDYGDGHGWTSIITSNDATRLERHFTRQYAVTVPGEQLLSDFAQTREEGGKTFTYRKNTFYNFTQFFKIVPNAASALKNSVVVSLITILISLTLGSLAGYALARYTFKGKSQLNVGLLIVRMFPTVGISIPMAVMLIRMGLFDTMLGLAILYSIPNIALTSWITSSIFVGIHRELEEASLVFGANSAQTFLRITLPLAFPAMAASSMYAFTTAWNDTISALILTNNNQTLALVVYKAIGTTSSGIQYAAAGSIILILPALVFTFIIRKYIGQMWGGVQM